jgi:hypothetical protein
MRGTYQVKSQKSKVKSQKSKVKSQKCEEGKGTRGTNAQCPMPNAQ